MSNCIKELYDYNLIKKCCKCENISLKSNFHKKLKSKDGLYTLYSNCKSCIKNYKMMKIVNYYLII